MIIVNSQEGEGELVMSPHIHIERYLDLQIMTLVNATARQDVRNADKLERLLESKRRQKEDNF
jgi:hypothetical protein